MRSVLLWPAHLFSKLPPWGVVVLAFIYLLAGITHRELWKGQDAIYIASGVTLIRGGNWLLPHVGTTLLPQPYPLYGWMSVLTGSIFQHLFELHNAIRMASSVFAGLMLWFAYLASRELNRDSSPTLTVLILLSCLGLILPIHDAHPATALMACVAAALYGLSLVPRLPWKGGLIAGASGGLGGLAAGFIAPSTLTVFSILLLFNKTWRKRSSFFPFFVAILLPWIIFGLWVYIVREELPRGWWREGWVDNSIDWTYSAGDYLWQLVTWYAWPALPVALWMLWSRRRTNKQPEVIFAVLFFVLWWIAAALFFPQDKEIYALPLLIPLTFLAARNAETLRRDESQAYNAFAVALLTIVIVLCWLGWIAMYFHVPNWANNFLNRYEPGFVAPLRITALIIAVLATAIWLWSIIATPRSPTRGITHWALGLAISWLLLVTLWQPWFDYGKSYEKVARDLVTRIGKNDRAECILKKDLGLAQEASFYYYANLSFVSAEQGKQCPLLLVQGAQIPDLAQWRRLWVGRRLGDAKEIYRLYKRKTAADQADKNSVGKFSLLSRTSSSSFLKGTGGVFN